MPRDLLRSLERNALTHGRGRTGLPKWLFDHYDELAPALSKPRAPWTALAKTAAENGLKRIDGKPFSRQALRHAWKALERAKAELPKAPVPSVPPERPKAVPPTPAPKQAQPPGRDTEDAAAKVLRGADRLRHGVE